MINKSGVRLMPMDSADDAMDIFFGIGEVQLYQVRCFCRLLCHFA